MLRGDIVGSFRAHPLGPIIVLAAFLAVIAIPITLLKGRSGKADDTEIHEERVAGRRNLSLILIGLIILAWIINIARAFGLISW
jgi:hypothetical protein